MARPREFEMEAALDGAMQIFWRLGYAATNLPDLLTAMGLTRGSFYKAFGDKHSAYLAALDHYDQVHIGGAVALLEDRSVCDGTTRILKLFGNSAPKVKSSLRGCFVCNAMVELAPHDGVVAKKTCAMSCRLERAFYMALCDVSALEGDVDASKKRKAAIITRLYFGGQAMSKTGEDDSNWKILLGELLGSKTVDEY